MRMGMSIVAVDSSSASSRVSESLMSVVNGEAAEHRGRHQAAVVNDHEAAFPEAEGCSHQSDELRYLCCQRFTALSQLRPWVSAEVRVSPFSVVFPLKFALAAILNRDIV